MKNYQHPIIDSHHHFWDLELEKNQWLLNQPDPTEEDHLGDITELRNSYLPSHFIKDFNPFNISKSVHIQAGWDRSDLTGESEWLLMLNKKWNFPNAIVAYADLSKPSVESDLEKLAQVPKVRGIRQILSWHENSFYNGCEKNYIRLDQWRKNFKLLKKYNLSFDMQIYPEQVDEILPIINHVDCTDIVIDHCLMPTHRRKDYLIYWKEQLKKLSHLSNVKIKISGISMFDPTWNHDSLENIITSVIEIFTPKRCMFGSNFPVDKLFGSYDALLSAYIKHFSVYSEAEQENMLYKTAENFYKLSSD